MDYWFLGMIFISVFIVLRLLFVKLRLFINTHRVNLHPLYKYETVQSHIEQTLETSNIKSELDVPVVPDDELEFVTEGGMVYQNKDSNLSADAYFGVKRKAL